jgi:hypothetical protein
LLPPVWNTFWHLLHRIASPKWWSAMMMGS